MNKLFDMTILFALQAMGVKVYNDAATIEELSQRLIDLHEETEGIQNCADAEARELTKPEAEKIAANLDEFEAVQAKLTIRERIAGNAVDLNASRGRQAQPAAAATVTGVEPQAHAQPRPSRVFQEPADPQMKKTWGFRSFGDFAKSIKQSAGKGAVLDPRLVKNAPTTYSSEGVGAEGGFALPPEFRSEIKDLIFTDDALIGMADQMTTSSNSMTVPVDENAAWDSTDGVQAYWESEAAQFSQSKISLQERQIKTNKLTSLVPVTEELLEDASGIDSYLRRKVPEKMDAKINTSLISGTGAGMPLGILNAPAKIAVAKESGQAADTVQFKNIVNMWARMPHVNRRNAVWLINQDIEPQLDTMVLAGASSDVPVYLPANGISAAPYATLKGRPVMPIQACKTLGDEGDIILADMAQYMALVKTGGVRTDVSMHLWFDYDVMAFRFIIRLAGQPWLSSAITPENGSNTLSPFITLAARA